MAFPFASYPRIVAKEPSSSTSVVLSTQSWPPLNDFRLFFTRIERETKWENHRESTCKCRTTHRHLDKDIPKRGDKRIIVRACNNKSILQLRFRYYFYRSDKLDELRSSAIVAILSRNNKSYRLLNGIRFASTWSLFIARETHQCFPLVTLKVKVHTVSERLSCAW